MKKIIKKSKKLAKEKPIGKVIHYYGDIKVAVIKLSAPIKEGQKIRITGGEDTDFSQEIKSIQVDHEKIKSAKKGKVIGLKVSKKVRESYLIFKSK